MRARALQTWRDWCASYRQYHELIQYCHVAALFPPCICPPGAEVVGVLPASSSLRCEHPPIESSGRPGH